jgi:hypothetical protein
MHDTTWLMKRQAGSVVRNGVRSPERFRRRRRHSLKEKDLLMTTYNVKIRFKGTISYVTVNASSAGLAKQMVLAQYGGQVDVLSVSRA